MRTVALYNIFGVSKAKTAKAVLLHETTTDRMAWISTLGCFGQVYRHRLQSKGDCP